MQDVAQFRQLGYIRHGIASFPVGNRLIADAHGIRQVHLRHILRHSCLFDFSSYFCCFKHNVSSPSCIG